MVASASFARSEASSAAPERSIDELDAAISRLAGHISAETYRLLALVREFDERLGFAQWSFPSCAEWLAWRCSLSLSAAREKVRTAHALPRLPAIAAAFAAGRLSYSKVRALTRVAHVHDEEALLAYALEASAAQVEERCRLIRNVAPEATEAALHAWQRRSLSVGRNSGRGTLSITVEVPIEEGEIIVRALDRAVEAGEVAVAPESRADGWRAQQADALVAVARAYLADDGAGDGRSAGTPDNYQVVVHVDEAALRGGVSAEASAKARPRRADLPLEAIRRLLCDGSMIAVAESARGTPLDVGRKQRTVSTALKRALVSRDRGCAFPGCRHTRYLHAHHLHHWVDGGETRLDNLTLLCSYHHRLLHEGGYRIERERDDRLRFVRPDGRAIPPCGYRLAEWQPSAEVGEARGRYRIAYA